MSIIVIFFIVLFFILVYFFSKTRPQAIQDTNIHVVEPRGLDHTFLETIGVIPFDPKRFKDGLQCAVCLCEVKEGEKTRILPDCEHVFHMECIDMWFHSHSTCPICRNPVGHEPLEILVEVQDSRTMLVEGDEVDRRCKGSTSELASASSSLSLITNDIVDENTER
ncbi:RING-H2 finger protein ATL13-like [Bidens hawaiensis]|uniref:RING-H2 finger protein ATL13-like n=1 Tax=Bidens hawaiensis TaxID=980011 RepID=UPI0040492CD9